MNNLFMQKAIEVAQQSTQDIPIGAVIVHNNKIISAFYNQKEQQNNALYHAEILAINDASKKLNKWRLDDCDLYVTLEPCPMCAWAILQARIKNVYFGAYDNLYGALGSKTDLRSFLNSTTSVKGGIEEDKCKNILDEYFEKIRNGKN